MANDKVKAVNDLLLQGEPTNISVDTHSGYTGYEPQAVVDAMNEVFYGEWGFTEISNEIRPGEKSGLAVAKVEVWLKGNDFHPTAWGQNRVTRGDEGDAQKGAQTDAIKKALSYFSIGNRAYHGLLPNKQEQAAQAREANNQRPATPAARPAQSAPVSENKPVEKPAQAIATPERIYSVSQLRTLAAKHVGPNAFNAIVGMLQPIYKNVNLQVDDAWQEKQCQHAYSLLKKQIDEKKNQPAAKAS